MKYEVLVNIGDSVAISSGSHYFGWEKYRSWSRGYWDLGPEATAREQADAGVISDFSIKHVGADSI